MFGLYFIVSLRVHGIANGFRKILYLPPFIAFSQYGPVVCYKALFVRTWGTTKTIHGFTGRPPNDNTVESRAKR